MKKVVLDETHGEGNEHHIVEAILKDSGDLSIEGYDIGESVKEYWGDIDYEYWVIVKDIDVDDVLLQLIKDRFKKVADFMNWLKNKGIPSKFSSWV